MRALDREWERIGVQSHPQKMLDSIILGELQGAEAGDEAPFLGLGAAKVLLFGMLVFDTVASWRPRRRVVERILGKASHLCDFAPPPEPLCKRSIP